jgi:hypothetical protein
MPNVKPIVAQLRQLADEFEQHQSPSRLIAENYNVTLHQPHRNQLTIRLALDTTRLKFVTEATPLAIRERADNLTRYARVLGSGYTAANKQVINRRKPIPTSRPPKFSRKLYNEFFNAREFDNAESYYYEYHPRP